MAEVEPPVAASMEKSIPTPARAPVCGLPVASSVIVMFAARFPVAVGLKVTLIVQLAPAATLAPQVFVWEKSPLFVPATVMLAMFNESVPLFESVTFCGALPVVTSWPAKVRLGAESMTDEATPVPLTVKLCGLPEASSVIVTDALRVPLAEGLKLTLIVQLAVAGFGMW